MKKVWSVIVFIWRTAVISVVMTFVIKSGSALFEKDGMLTLMENITAFSANTIVIYEEKETEISYFEPVTTVSETTTAATTSATVIETTVTTTVPTGENIKKISEEQLKKGTVSFGNIHVKNTNKNHSIDIEEVLAQEPVCKIKTDGSYQVLIVHTHTTESYADEDRSWYSTDMQWRNTDDAKNITSVGAVIAENLNEAGIKTLHVTVKHDYPKYNGAYTRAKDTINEYIKKYPSIQMVIDVHRDSITRTDGTKVKPTAIINGKKAAQLMIISGCDDEGDLEFPNWSYNLRMAMQIQKQLTEDWPGLARPLYFAPFRYNMHMTYNSLLFEFGTEANTLEEAKYSAELVSQSLITVLSRYITEEE